MPNPYPPRFNELLDALPPDARVLDCGSGPRRHPDRRVITFDADGAEVCGDLYDLPFADGTFDLICSQAVLEHVPDPQGAVDEMVRVLKPGGTLYVIAASMQPLHEVPGHFFGIYPDGLALLCRELDEVDSGTAGTLADVWKWIGNLVTPSVDRILVEVRKLDRELPEHEKRTLATAAWFVGVKP